MTQLRRLLMTNTYGMRLLGRVILFSVAWWIIAEGAASSWLFGGPFVLFASLASLRLTPQRLWRLDIAGGVRFLGFFAYHSLLGGVDVALRALRPSMPIAPGFVRCPLRLARGPARVLLTDTVSLLPGTLSAGIEGDTLVMHVLDCTAPVIEEVRVVEERVAAALSLCLMDVVDDSAEGECARG